MDAHLPSLSVVIPTLNRPELLRQCVEAATSRPDLVGEVIIVDQSDPPWSPPEWDIAGVPVQHVHREYRNISRARNDGVQLASGEVVLFVDDDVRVTPGCIEAHLRAHAPGTHAAVTGPILHEGEELLAASQVSPELRALAETGAAGPMAVDFPYDANWAETCNLSCRREAFVAIGGFDEQLARFNEDAELCYRLRAAGHRIRHVPEAIVLHAKHAAGGNRDFPDSREELRRKVRDTCYFLRAIDAPPRTRAKRLWNLYRRVVLNRRTVRHPLTLLRSAEFAALAARQLLAPPGEERRHGR